MQNDVSCIKKRMTTVRKTIEIDIELSNTIQELADKQKWSFSKMGAVLLQQAAKERNRKKKNAKEDNSQSNSQNMG